MTINLKAIGLKVLTDDSKKNYYLWIFLCYWFVFTLLLIYQTHVLGEIDLSNGGNIMPGWGFTLYHLMENLHLLFTIYLFFAIISDIFIRSGFWAYKKLKERLRYGTT